MQIDGADAIQELDGLRRKLAMEATENESRMKLLRNYHFGIQVSEELADEVSRQLRLNETFQTNGTKNTSGNTDLHFCMYLRVLRIWSFCKHQKGG